MLAVGAGARSLRHRGEPEEQAVARVLYVLVLLILFMQLVTNYFVNVGFPHLFWLLTALLYAGAPAPVGAAALHGGRGAVLPRTAVRLKRFAVRGDGRRATARVDAPEAATRPPHVVLRREQTAMVDATRTTSSGPAAPFDLNTATADQFTQVPGVGPVTARRIIDRRTERGGFGSVDELRQVHGIGPKRLAALRPWVHT
jgi:competence ComEA-like helix-hairpin-helix protein